MYLDLDIDEEDRDIISTTTAQKSETNGAVIDDCGGGLVVGFLVGKSTKITKIYSIFWRGPKR